MASSPATEPQRLRVLQVVDDRGTREMLALALSLEGFEVRTVTNGLRLISCLHVDRPSLLLVDLSSGWADGAALCQALRQNDEFQALPIVLIRSKKGTDDRARLLESGASDVFPAPLHVDQLLQRIRALVGPNPVGSPP
jgi:DNA-binding response OmpR family regulator